MKKLILLIAVVMTTVCMSAQSEAEAQPAATLKFGYVSYTEVLKAMPEYAEAQQSLAELRATYDKELSRSEQEFSRQYSEYIDGQKSFPENILLKRQKELQQLMEQSLSFKAEAQQMLANAEKELMTPVYDRLTEHIHAVGLAKGYAFILNTDGNACPFVNPAMGENATIAILEEIKK